MMVLPDGSVAENKLETRRVFPAITDFALPVTTGGVVGLVTVMVVLAPWLQPLTSLARMVTVSVVAVPARKVTLDRSAAETSIIPAEPDRLVAPLRLNEPPLTIASSLYSVMAFPLVSLAVNRLDAAIDWPEAIDAVAPVTVASGTMVVTLAMAGAP